MNCAILDKPKRLIAFGVLFATCLATPLAAQTAILAPPAEPKEAIREFVAVPAGHVALAHVTLIDGTGGPAQPDRTILIDGYKIAAILPGNASLPTGVRVLDLTGRSVLPGIVGMHNHLYYIARPNLHTDGHSEGSLLVPQMTFTSPRMYLAGGITTMRTTGSVETYTDLNLKQAIDSGDVPGPHLDVTGPYLEGASSLFFQMHRLEGPGDAAALVDYWADQGVTSFKAYMNITRAELKAAIDAVHARGLKITGHLCSVTYPEAVELGIDNLEHGFWANTQLDSDKQLDACSPAYGAPTLLAMTSGSPQAKALIDLLVANKVAVTSTLPVFENASPNYRILPQRQLDTLTSEARADYLIGHARIADRPPEAAAMLAKMWANELALERAFVAAGGLLIAGPDPTGAADVLPGFGDQRAIALLVQAGFTPLEAIRIGTLNGAKYLGLDDRIGSIVVGKHADLMVVKGDPSKLIDDIEDVEIVFKDGTGWDSAKLLDSVRGRYGQY